jgi:hypothetical protein
MNKIHVEKTTQRYHYIIRKARKGEEGLRTPGGRHLKDELHLGRAGDDGAGQEMMVCNCG